MRQFVQLVVTIVLEAAGAVVSWLHNNLRNIANVLGVICPYATGWAIIQAYIARGYIGVGGEWFVPLVFWLVMYLLRAIANKTGKGTSIPRPRKRFTEVTEEGEVSVPMDRSEEMILYLCDLEDWMERKGLM